MSTRSTIAIEREDNVIKKIYCHYDGYIKHNGRILLERYPTWQDAQALVSRGDLRGFVGETKEPSHFSGEPPMFPETYDYKSYLQSIDHTLHEYNYIMRKNGKWEVISACYDKPSKAKSKMLTKCVAASKRIEALSKKQKA